MRVACFSPLPPRKSGIADYAAALLPHLANEVDLAVFAEDAAARCDGVRPRPYGEYRRSDFDVALYQIGNNPDHIFVYDEALRTPGVVVLHEFNLHHLVAAATIKRGDWDAYLQEVQHNGGPEHLAYAQRVRRLEVGPDYDNLPMNRRLLESSRGLIVHSRFMAEQARSGGWNLPAAVIPHGAWMPEARRLEFRQRLGVDEATPLIGIFGFLKPYKRIAEALRAFQRLVRTDPRVKMILVGEEHPDFSVRRIIRSLDLERNVRVLGYVPIEDFPHYIGAADICLNLRYPTVGESSGTLLRALGLGRAVVVSEVGSFAELPGEVCLKVPVDEREVDFLFEYMNLLVSRPEVARTMGENARRYATEHCSWEAVARQYAGFLDAVAQGREWTPAPAWKPAAPQPAAVVEAPASPPPAAEAPGHPSIHPPIDPWGHYILGFARSEQDRDYIRTHLTRLVHTLAITPRGGPEDRILEMGAYMQITPALKTLLGYGEVRGSYLGPLGRVDHREVCSATGERFACEIDLFDAEKDRFPYPDGHFATVLCCELLEHLYDDPMQMMGEINRVLRPGGALVLTTPNICSLRAVAAILLEFHPGFFHQYVQPDAEGEIAPRHAREYAPRDVELLFDQAGFEISKLETGPYLAEPSVSQEWVVDLLDRYQLSKERRGEGIFVVGSKAGGVKSRYPEGLYAGGGE